MTVARYFVLLAKCGGPQAYSLYPSFCYDYF
jgi:hypothetical protein